MAAPQGEGDEDRAGEASVSKVVVSMNVAIDGVIEAPERWSFPYWCAELSESAEEELSGSDALLLGRLNYEAFAGFWPTATNEPGIADRMNNLPKHVASTTLEEPLEWSDSTLIRGDVVDEVAKRKQEPGKDILVFSADLARTLAERDLVDEYRIRVAPVVAGSGKRLCADGGGIRP